MARIKQAAPRNPNRSTQPPLRRSSRRQAVVRPPATTNLPPETVDLEDESVSPIRDTELRQRTSRATREWVTAEENALQIVPYIGPESTIVRALVACFLQVNLPPNETLIEGETTSCTENEEHSPQITPISSTRVGRRFFEHSHDQYTGFIFGEAENTPKTFTESSTDDEVIVEPLETHSHKRTDRVELPDLNEIHWPEDDDDENEPLIKHISKKRKTLGKVYATRSTAKHTPRKRTRSTRETGEASGTKPRETDCDAAASVQHQKSVKAKGKKKKEAESHTAYVDRPNAPHQGFSSKAAAKVWSKFSTRIGLPDKGFDEQSLREFHFIKEVVDTQGLEKVCEVYSSYNLTLMREFYCEISVTSAPTITIRGITVKLTSKAINRFLNLQPPKKTEYHAMVTKASPIHLAETAAVLGKPRTDWEPHANFMLRTFKALNLTASSNVWINFIRHSISPTTHDNTISIDRMFLLYCLVTGKSINLGKLMVKSIRECASRTRGKLYFPGMLTNFLIQAGVKQYNDDLIVKEQREKWEIDMKAVTRLTSRQDKTVGASELMGMVQDLLNQNTNLMEDLNKQRKEWTEKNEEMSIEVHRLVKGNKRQAAEKAGYEKQISMLKKKLSKKKARIEKLKAKIKNLKTEAAAAAKAVQQPTHP